MKTDTSNVLSQKKEFKKYLKPKINRSKMSLNLFYMDFYGILTNESSVLLACSAPPSQCVG